jgi:HEAT repeat protein
MGLFKKTILIFLCSCSLSFALEIDKRHILYLMHSNEIEKSLIQYQKAYEQEPLDLEVLQKMSLILLKNGAQSEDSEIQKLSMFGAGLSASNIALDILEVGLKSSDMQTQLLSLHFISLLNDNKTDLLLTKAMRSDFLPTRLEAAYHMAMRKHPHAIGQIESLMFKLPVFLKPFFPHLFALLGTDEANRYLLKFLNDSSSDVRLETILSIANFQKDDLLSHLRKRFANSTIAEKEAICYCFQKLNDTSSLEDLKKLSTSNIENVKLSALRAMFHLEDYSIKTEIEKLAMQNDLFAISLLKEIDGTQDTLHKLLNSQNKLVKMNAAISLLHKKDPKCLIVIKEILIDQLKDLAIEPFFSIGRTMMYFKTTPLAVYRIKKVENDPSLTIREALLKEALELDEDSFLWLVKQVFESSANELVPMCITLLENLASAKATDYLKQKAQKSQNALIKDYSNLALYRLKIEGPYEKYISNWIKHQHEDIVIQLSFGPDSKSKQKDDIYSLTKEEATRLLLDMFVALSSKQDENSLKIIVDAIKNTNPKNRYALAGMLIRATQ